MSKELMHFGILGMKWGRRQNKAHDDFQAGLKKLHSQGKGNDQKAVDKLAAKYDADRSKQASQKNIEKAAKKAEKALAKLAKDELEAARIRKSTRDEIEFEVATERNSYAKASRHGARRFDEAAYRAKIEKFYDHDLNMTPEGLHKERVQTGVTLATAALLIVGSKLLSNYLLNSAIKKAAGFH